MINYVRADVNRLARKIPRVLLLAAFVIIHIIILCYAFSKKENAAQFLGTFEMSFEIFASLIALIEFGAIFADCIKAKIFEAGIGHGLGRGQVLLAKYSELMIVLFVNYAVFVILSLILNLILGAHLSGEQVGQVVILFVTVWMEQIGLLGFAMIPTFGLENTTLGIILYLALIFGLDGTLLGLLKGVKGLEGLTLENYTFEGLLDKFQSHLFLGTFSWVAFAGMVIYLVLSIGIALQIFRRKELEF